MPKTYTAYMDQLDDITDKMHDLVEKIEENTSRYITLEAQYELVEAEVYSNMRSEGSSPNAAAEEARYRARAIAEAEHELLWTRLNNARSQKEETDRIFRLYDATRSNIQSNLRAISQTESTV